MDCLREILLGVACTATTVSSTDKQPVLNAPGQAYKLI